MRGAALLALLPLPALADVAVLRVESGPRVLQAEVGEIASAQLAPDVNGDPVAWIQLDPSRHEDWLAFTKASLGEEAAVSVCGRIVSAPVVQTPISGGVIGIMGLPEPELMQLVGHLAGHLPCGAAP